MWRVVSRQTKDLVNDIIPPVIVAKDLVSAMSSYSSHSMFSFFSSKIFGLFFPVSHSCCASWGVGMWSTRLMFVWRIDL